MKSAKTSKPAPPSILLQPCDPAAMQWEMQQVQLGIARRAFELFEARNREHGHDWEDWFQAESELLRPVSTAISETANRFSLRANVLGLSGDELKVSLEPKRVVILGGRAINPAGQKETPSADFYPDQILKVITLTSEIDPEGAVVELQGGVLRFELPKVKKSETMAAGAGQ